MTEPDPVTNVYYLFIVQISVFYSQSFKFICTGHVVLVYLLISLLCNTTVRRIKFICTGQVVLVYLLISLLCNTTVHRIKRSLYFQYS